tara:strand:+ start:1186 stop:1749 length:564 start_codon:yes stop_codon:yes gene_type:complete
MTSKTIYVYESNKLFEILNEIKDHFNFDILCISKKDYQNIRSNLNKNILVITFDNNLNLDNCLVIDKVPQKLSKILERINLFYLKNQFNKKSNLKIGKYNLDLNSRKITFHNLTLNLTEKESNLILFMNTKNKVSLKEIQKKVWGYSSDLETHTVETHIYRLRKKILKSFGDESFIKNDREGYFLNF